MKMKKFGGVSKLAVLLVVLVSTEGWVLFAAGPCYNRTGTPVVCDWGACAIIKPAPALPCPGGPWTVVGLAVNGLSAAWPCDEDIVRRHVPKNYSFTGNDPTGYMSVGPVAFVCESHKTCEKVVAGVPLLYNCIASFSTCTTTLRTTAHGADCPGPITGGGTQ